MYKCFKKSRILWWVVLILELIFIALFFVDLEVAGRKVLPPFGVDITLHWILMLWVLSPIVAGIISEIYARKLMRAVDSILYEECDPCKFVAEYERFLPKTPENIIPFMYLMICNGCLLAGDIESAKKYIDQIKGFPKNKAKNALYRLVHYSNMVGYSSSFEDWVATDNWLEKMKEILDDSANGIKPNLRDGFRLTYISQLYAVNISKGEFEGAEEVFLADINTSKSKISKVLSQHRLGKVYLHFNRLDEAKAAFEYVITNGNTTGCVTEAKELLEHING